MSAQLPHCRKGLKQHADERVRVLSALTNTSALKLYWSGFIKLRQLKELSLLSSFLFQLPRPSSVTARTII